MTKKLIIAMCILLTGQLLSQPLPQWTSGIGSNFSNYFYDNPKIKFDNAGDLIVCGNIMSSTDGKNILLIKYTPFGSIIWLKTYNGLSNKDDEAIDFEIDNQNNIYVTGNTTINTNNSNAITIKFDSSGNLIWQNIFNGYCNRNDQGQSITLDINNNSYITGFTEVDSSNWRRKIFIRKIDANGSTVWSKRHGADSLARYDGVKIKFVNNEVRLIGNSTAPNKYIVMNLDLNGNYIFANEAPYIKGMSSTFIDKFGNFYWGAWVAYKTTKVNYNGNLAWIDSVGTNLPSNVSGDEVCDLVVDTLQNVYTTGRHYGSDYNGPTYTNADILTIKYSSNGSIQWSKRYEYLSYNTADIGNSICLDSSLNVYVGGQSQRTAVATDYDYVVIRYNNSGIQSGIIRYNNPISTNDAISSIIVDKFGCIYATGLTMDNLSTSNTTTQKYCTMTGINEYSDDLINLSAFPNPFSTVTHIELPNNEEGNLYVKLYNTTGQLVFDQIYSGTNKLQINPINLTPGLYNFIIKSNTRHYKGKLIKLE